MTRPTVHIFAKAPEPGRVKTRLARTVGDHRACEIYRRLLKQITRRLAAAPDWLTVLTVTPDPSAQQEKLWPEPIARQPQGDGDLGDRMYRVLATATHDAPVVIVGSDIPDLAASHVSAAFLSLQDNHLVFGPAIDGGFWLVGAACPPPSTIFENVRWSSAFALSDTLKNAVGLKTVVLDDHLEDLDDAESLARLRDRIDD
ncbi:MAG: TIGR04282 family arsenosugar biosynthesis glycosyltransferase [Pseudomonadota bacterium]